MSSPNNSGNKELKRVPIACLRCRHKKLKCRPSDQEGKCIRCAEANADCKYVPVPSAATSSNNEMGLPVQQGHDPLQSPTPTPTTTVHHISPAQQGLAVAAQHPSSPHYGAYPVVWQAPVYYDQASQSGGHATGARIASGAAHPPSYSMYYGTSQPSLPTGPLLPAAITSSIRIRPRRTLRTLLGIICQTSLVVSIMLDRLEGVSVVSFPPSCLA
ncbi:hypothetical protein BDZ97DRAFT_1751066 [Flammula alnicola]|nr:hypothetical protein BDZ97DRAFT_1751066 [Flammula alnicola]